MSDLYRAYKLATQRQSRKKVALAGGLMNAARRGVSRAAAAAAPAAAGARRLGPYSAAEMQAMRTGLSGLAGAVTGYGADQAYGTLSGNDSPGYGALIGGLAGGASAFSKGPNYLYTLLKQKGFLGDSARQLTAYGVAVPVARGVQNAAGSEYDVTRPIQTIVRPAQAKQQEIESKLNVMARLRDKYRWLLG